ncbi:MAG: AraC family transcriptional regulator [Clostridia bacterium]|nr:AraC family transcriptional regulator [Clostridia bacterium]
MTFRYDFSDLYYAHKIDEPAPLGGELERDHIHPLYEMLYFLDGDAEFKIGEERYDLSPGDIMIARPGTHHNVHLLSSQRYERYVVNLSEYLVPSEIAGVFGSLEGRYSVRDTIIPSLFERFDAHAGYVGGDLVTVKMLFRCVVTEIMVYLCNVCGAASGGALNVLKNDMALIMDYINKNIERPLNLDDICEKFHYSKSYMCSEFSKRMGKTIMGYIRTRKILYADALLRSGMKATEISDFLGFNDYSTFFRMYKKIMGRAPTERGA